jgi:hypothetical protein
MHKIAKASLKTKSLFIGSNTISQMESLAAGWPTYSYYERELFLGQVYHTHAGKGYFFPYITCNIQNIHHQKEQVMATL